MSLPARRAEQLVRFASQRVPLWRDLLGGGPAAWELVPVTDRALLSERFDDTIADRAVSRREAEAHYCAAPDRPMPRGIHVFVSAGACGKPLPILHDSPSWRAQQRSLCRALAALGSPQPARLALVGTDDPAHTLPRLKRMTSGTVAVIGLQRGVERACEELERFQPDAIYGIASAIAAVAHLGPKIAPTAVLTGTDGLDEEESDLVRRVVGVAPRACYATTEAGLIGAQCRFGGDMHVNADAVLIESVPGGACVTNLVNRIQPIIRLQLPERIELHRRSCPCGGSSLRLRLYGGRATRTWQVPGTDGRRVTLHPIVFRSALDPLLLRRLPQIRWTEDRMHVLVEPERIDAARERLVPAFEVAGADSAALVVSGRAGSVNA